jgi:hypothetical protein
MLVGMADSVVHMAPKQKHALVAKFLNCVVAAGGSDQFPVAARIAEERVPALPVLAKILQRTAVGAMPLGSNDPFGFSRDTYLALVVSDLRALFDRFVRVPPRLKVPLENASGGSAAWVGQGLPAPVLKSTTAVATLDIFQMVALTVLSRELFRFDANSESTFMRLLRDDVSRFLATALFDPTLGATSARPAALTFGAGFITSTGTTAAQMIADLNSMIANVNTAQVDLAWSMRPKTFHRIAATLGGAGLTVTKDNLLGIPVTLLSGMPREVVLVDCAAVLLASDDAAELSVSTDASIEMSDAPSSSGISGAGASLVSFFQSGLVGISATLTTNWASPYQINASPAVPSGVVYMSTSY